MREEKEVLTKNFLDPDSVNYRKPKVRQATADDGEELLSLCGEVNAKNAMGTYAGYKKLPPSEKSQHNFCVSRGFADLP